MNYAGYGGGGTYQPRRRRTIRPVSAGQQSGESLNLLTAVGIAREATFLADRPSRASRPQRPTTSAAIDSLVATLLGQVAIRQGDASLLRNEQPLKHSAADSPIDPRIYRSIVFMIPITPEELGGGDKETAVIGLLASRGRGRRVPLTCRNS